MTEPTWKEDILSKVPRSKEDFWLWSFFGSLGLTLLSEWIYTNRLPPSSRFVEVGLKALVSGILIFLYWLFIRWVATTAEKASRSFVGFMIFAILAPAIAWIVVIMFKKPQPIDPVAWSNYLKTWINSFGQWSQSSLVGFGLPWQQWRAINRRK